MMYIPVTFSRLPHTGGGASRYVYTCSFLENRLFIFTRCVTSVFSS